MKRKHRSTSEWQLLVAKYKSLSGVSKSSFCKAEGISESGLYKQLRKQSEPKITSRGDFVSVPVKQESPRKIYELNIFGIKVLRLQRSYV